MWFSNNQNAFLTLVRAGLWADTTVNGSWPMDFGSEQVDWGEVYQLAVEQTVIGVVLAGIEHSIVKPPRDFLLQWIGEVQIIEQQNMSMNEFVAKLIQELRKEDVYAILVKGQGIAQCYNRPLWRSSGDVDLYLSNDNFQKAKRYLRPLVDSFDPDDNYAKHINMHYGDWVVEVHANQYSSLSSRINRVMDEIHHNIFNGGNVRSWNNNNTLIFLPAPDNDVLIVFTHFLNHFYKGGVGLRQICDWCRLLWTYKDSLNHELLESRIRKAGLMSEWKAFAAFAVDYLGMPKEAMPLYNNSKIWSLKAQKINNYILQVGNFGHNRNSSYYEKYPFLIRKFCSFSRRVGDSLRHSTIFPVDSLRFCLGMIANGLRHVAHGE